MSPYPPQTWVPLLLALALSACSQAGKPLGRGGVPLLAQIVAEPVLTEEALERLKAIADAPSSHLPSRGVAELDEGVLAFSEGSEGGANAAIGLGTRSPEPLASRTSPESAWRRGGFEPRRVALGDIFSEHAGPLLNKAFSFADLLPAAQWEGLLAELAESRVVRVPLTLTARDIAALREQLDDAGTPFPTRSVALDLRTETLTADSARLQELYRRAARDDASFPDALARSLRDAQGRLERGEKLFVVTAVTRSLSAQANYPGAPVGQRDAEAIRNALLVAYPHLNGLEARREGNAVIIHRDPELYWEFDTREIALGPTGLEILPLARD